MLMHSWCGLVLSSFLRQHFEDCASVGLRCERASETPVYQGQSSAWFTMHFGTLSRQHQLISQALSHVIACPQDVEHGKACAISLLRCRSVRGHKVD